MALAFVRNEPGFSPPFARPLAIHKIGDKFAEECAVSLCAIYSFVR
jgi:hypothetical protein